MRNEEQVIFRIKAGSIIKTEVKMTVNKTKLRKAVKSVLKVMGYIERIVFWTQVLYLIFIK